MLYSLGDRDGLATTFKEKTFNRINSVDSVQESSEIKLDLTNKSAKKLLSCTI